MPVSKDNLLAQIEADSSLEIKERCVIGWIAAVDFYEDKKTKPPFSYCNDFSNEELYKLRNLAEGRN